MDPTRATWPRASYEAGPRRHLSRDSRWKPQVWEATTPDGAVRIVKDCRPLPWWSRWLARPLMGRERRILARLDGVAGVPQLAEALDRDAFAMKRLEGEPLTPETFRLAPRRLADQLQERASALHERGVFHLDLRQRQNLLVGPGLELQVVDFGAAWAPWAPLRWLLGGLLRRVDRSAALKYLARFAPEELAPEEAEELWRGLRWRRLWIFSPYRSRGIEEVLQARRRGQDVSRS